MENEELHWKIRQSLDHSYGGNCSGLLSMSVIEGKFFLVHSFEHICCNDCVKTVVQFFVSYFAQCNHIC